MSESPSVSLSFANNFWGKDDAGVGPMLDRMHYAKVTNDELKSFYAQRAAIEEEYSRKLLNLSRKPLGSTETGTLKLSCDVIRAEVESMGKSHQNVSQQMKTELEEPLAAFAGGMKERRKIVQNGIEKVLKLKMQQTGTVNKARDRYEQDCLKIKGFLAQAHMVMGHEERKNKAKLEKTQINLTTTSAEYEAAVKVLEETTGRWNRDWKAACDKFQDLEEERIDFTKSSLWGFANIASTVCVSDDASCEKIRLSLEDCDVEKDITSFIKDSGTGQEIPDPPKFINFCRGDAETSSQVSDDDNYCVAQFARTMNPAYRASSPPISVFESHHDPNNPLARELGLQQDTQPILQDQISAMPKQSMEQQRPRPSIEQHRSRHSTEHHRSRHSTEQHRSRQSIEHQRPPPDLQRQYTESPRQFMESPQPPMEPLRRQHTEPPQQFIEPQRQFMESPQPHMEPLRRQHTEPPQQFIEHQRQYSEPPQQYVEPQRQYAEPARQYNEPPQQYNEPPQQYNEPPQQYNEPPQQYNESPRRHTTEQIQQHIEPPQYPAEPSRQSAELSRQYVEPPQQYPEPLRRQHTEPPRPFVESPRQSQELQRHRPELPRPFVESARQSVELQRHRPEPAQPAQPRPASRGVQPDPRLIQAQQQAHNNHQESQIPHNDYPSDGMTQFCRIGPPSDRSTIPSPARPATADSVSEYSNPTSFSSIEPPSGSASPGKPSTPQSPLPEPSPIEESSVAKKRSFFQNSPFRRKSKHEKEVPVINPSNRNTWAPAPRQTNNENVSPTRPFSRGTRRTLIQDKPRTASPEPVDPRANFQLNVGNNVFDVASPDEKKNDEQEEPQEEIDPITQALEELRGVTKQTSLRVTADRFHGLATPKPPPTPGVGSSLAGSAPTPLATLNVKNVKESTPPPSYEPPSAAQVPAALRPAPQRPVSKPLVTQRPVLQRPISKASVSKPAMPQSPVPRSPIVQSPIQQTPAPQSPLPQPRVPQSPAPQSPKPQVRVPQSPISQPRVAQPPVSQPQVTRPLISQPRVPQPPTIQTRVIQPPISQPRVVQPPVSEPPVPQQPVSQPRVAQPPASKPPVSKPAVSRPPVSKPPPAAQQPVPLQPLQQKPVQQQPVQQQPVQQKPAQQKPAQQQPVQQQPVPQQPVPQQPVPSMSRLGAPKPAHTARQMQKTTQMYVNQTANVFNGNDSTRPSTRGSMRQEEPPRAASPAPRAVSPRPSLYNTPKQTSSRPAPQQMPSRTPTQQSSSRAAQQQAPASSSYRPAQQQQQPPPSPSTYRPASRQQQPSPAPAPAAVPTASFRTATASPNPYATSNAGGRPRAQTNGSTTGQAYGSPVGRNSYSAARGPSPSVNTTPMPRAASPQPPPQPTFANSRPVSRAAPSSRAASPQPQFRQSNERPSTRGSERSMNMAPSERGEGSVFGGSVHGGSVYGGSVRGRPQSVYQGATGGSAASIRAESRTRSKSLAEPKNYNCDGRIILNYSRAMYSYTAQIPEELGFMKGDILAVLRLQDDGWWEAEAVGKNGRPGLVPSNYLQAC